MGQPLEKEVAANPFFYARKYFLQRVNAEKDKEGPS
jgi:hypothetical protein